MTIHSFGSYNSQDPVARAHDGECNCLRCHDWHITEGMVQDNAGKAVFMCCTDELAIMISDGKACPKHPRAYFEPSNGGRPPYCEACVDEIKPTFFEDMRGAGESEADDFNLAEVIEIPADILVAQGFYRAIA